MENKEFYTTNEVVKLAGLPKHTILKAIKNGKIIPDVIGRGRGPYKFNKKEVERFIASLSKSIPISEKDILFNLEHNKLLQQKKITEILIARHKKDRIKSYELLSELIDIKMEALELKKNIDKFNGK